MLHITLALGLLASAPPIGSTVEDAKSFPESISSTKDGDLIAGGTATGALYRGSVNDKTLRRWSSPASGADYGVFGVLVDEKRKALWACHVQRPFGKAATSLARYHLGSGKLEQSYAFPANGLCNDIALGADGTVYATDITNGQVLRLGKDGKIGVWSSGEPIAGIDGIVVHGGNSVVVNSITSGKLFALAIGRDGKAGPAKEIALSRPLERPDGMRLSAPDSLLVVESVGRLARVTLKGDTASVETLAEGMDGAVAVTPHDGRAYLIQAHFRFLSTPELKGQDPGPHGVYVVPLNAAR